MTDLPSETLRFADLANRSATTFKLEPTADDRTAIADALGISGLKKLSFAGEIAPDGERDWILNAKLGATVIQPCVATLDPVTTRIDEPTTLRYLAEMPELEGDDIEIPEDVSIEELPVNVDLYQVAIEALSLAIPQFPRSEGAEIGALSVTEPGLTPMTDEDAKPFAGLSALKDALEKKGSDGSS